jgi:membrane associated rhomboid family serine protease
VTQPDLFVVCKNCGSEVSPYVTECPYCGQRVRKRAPKLDRRATAEAPRRGRMRLPRVRPEEIEGIAPERRPWATLALIVVSLGVTLVVQAGQTVNHVGGLELGLNQEPWRYFTTAFVHGDSLGYQFVTMLATAIFGTLVERRFGPIPVVLLFILAGAAGAAVATALDVSALFESSPFTPVLGANGAALGLLCAWVVDDRRAARRGDERGNDLLGVAVIAAVLVLLSVAVVEANIAAALAGAAAGAILGLALPLFTRRVSY